MWWVVRAGGAFEGHSLTDNVDYRTTSNRMGLDAGVAIKPPVSVASYNPEASV